VSGPGFGLFRLELAGGEPQRIESWDRQTVEWFRNAYELDEPPPDSLDRLSRPWWMGSDGTGKVFILHERPSDPRPDAATDEVGAMLWAYDVAKDQWEETDLGVDLRMTVYDLGPDKVVWVNGWHEGPPWDLSAYEVFSNGQFAPLGPLPEGWLNAAEHASPIRITDKYIYAWTPLGLWRTLSNISPGEK
jgi:hypothetical protein